VATWVWLDGRLRPAEAPHLSVADRGFQLGDGIFETARVRRGVVIELEEHLRRLHESATAIALHLPVDDDRLVSGIDEVVRAEGLASDGTAGPPGDAAIRLTVSRGPVERRGLLPHGWESATATVAIQAWPYGPPEARLLDHGVRAVSSAVRRDPRSPLAGIKSTSRADYVFAKLEAERAGADDALFLTIDGEISEGTTANVWLLRGVHLSTPPLAAAILPGTTRTWLFDHAGDLGLEAQEVPIRPDDLVSADEAFLSSSVAGIVPLVALDGRPIGRGRPGPWTRGLREARERWIDSVARAVAAVRAAGQGADGQGAAGGQGAVEGRDAALPGVGDARDAG
jgi:branched-chain amino acid aminotransferase